MEIQSYDGFTFIDEDEGILNYRMDSNGMDVLLVPMDLAPVTVFMVTYRVGSRNESTGETGATHFLEHLMFKGTERFNRSTGQTIFNCLQRVGARVNATTWLDRTNYYELLPSDKLELAMEIEADRMRGALLGAEDVDSERTVILNELDRGENEPLRKLYQSVWSTAFVAHPYRHPTIGWRSDVENITPDQLRKFYDTFYWPNNATVSIIGDFDNDATLTALQKEFGSIPAGPEPFPAAATVEPVQLGSRKTTVRMAGEPGAVMIAYKSPPAADPDTATLAALSVILGTGKTSRLHRGLVDAGLATGVSASASVLTNPGLFYVYAVLTPGTHHETVETEIQNILRKLTASEADPDEIERAKALLRADTAYDRDGPFAMASSLNEAIAAGDWKLHLSIPREVQNVSSQSILEVSRKLFVDDTMTVGHFVPRPTANT